MKLPRRTFLHLAAGAAALPAVSGIARAYPSRPRSALVRNARNTDVVQTVLDRRSIHCPARCIAKGLDDLCGCAFRKKKGAPGHDVKVG